MSSSIRIGKDKKIETLEDFASILFTRSKAYSHYAVKIMDFYSQLSGKVNPYQELINTYKEILKAKGIEVEVKITK